MNRTDRHSRFSPPPRSASAGCVTHETRPQPRVKAIQAAQRDSAEQLLDVGVRLFDENVPEGREEDGAEAHLPRSAQSRGALLSDADPQYARRHRPLGPGARDARRRRGARRAMSPGEIVESNGQLLRARCHGQRRHGSPVVPQGIRTARRHALLQGQERSSRAIRSRTCTAISRTTCSRIASSWRRPIWKTCAASPSCASRPISRRMRSSPT